MNHQRDAYLEDVGNDWLKRNEPDLGKNGDPVLELLKIINPPMENILEVGCSNGWRLAGIRKEYPHAKVFGIDPSSDAVDAARANGIPAVVTTADNLPLQDGSMNVVIMGFCLWAIDPSDWMQAAAEADRVLKDGGCLVIMDRYAARPIRRQYPGRPDIYGYAYDWAKLWLSHPAYAVIGEGMVINPDTLTIEGAVMLRKDIYSRILTVREVA